MFFCDPDRDRRGDENLAVVFVAVCVGTGTRDRRRREKVDAERSVGAVLFGRSDRQECDVGVDLVDVASRVVGQVQARD